ncbi:D-alanine--D-alanine ligase family protein [Paramicrobacterium chengjingii]|uniref:D-alanine--D-alanine ligase family protein n=1 Tax=Paramicrobacterium chengjingii TaxID=2769067 RepID=UPI001421F8A0|nr:D-alanine--D-alanine ligase family protein [Microbacterium chengjingii]
MTRKLRVAVLFGGLSSEHSISCATAGGVLGAIDRDRFDVIPIGITRTGQYVLEEDDPRTFTLDGEVLPEVADNGTRVRWPDDVTSRELTLEQGGVTRSLGTIDVVFPILHGTYGEDGTIQGLLELAGLPYVGSGVLASALGMDKHFTKSVLQHAGISVAPWKRLRRAEWQKDPDVADGILDGLSLPVFVKPARAGSSVGVSRVSQSHEVAEALRIAFDEDDSVLVEQGVDGREVEIAVLGGRTGDAPRTSDVAGEIVVSGRDFYDFDAKYRGAAGIDLVCPADLSDAELDEMKSIALRAFDAVGAEGLARVDFFLSADGFVLNEVNTMPGFTPISMFPTCWIASGVSYAELITELIEIAVERGVR